MENKTEINTIPDSSESPEPPVALDKIVEIDKLTDNSVVIFRIKQMSSGLIAMLETFACRYGDKLRERNISIMVLQGSDTLETLDSTQMENLGWVKKGKVIV